MMAVPAKPLTTDANGKYVHEPVLPSDYGVTFTFPLGYYARP